VAIKNVDRHNVDQRVLRALTNASRVLGQFAGVGGAVASVNMFDHAIVGNDDMSLNITPFRVCFYPITQDRARMRGPKREKEKQKNPQGGLAGPWGDSGQSSRSSP
jgi:hypothetical protein